MKWCVDVSGYDTAYFEAVSKDKARYRAFVAFREAFGFSMLIRLTPSRSK